jgi:hypothetical protein
MFLLFNKVEYKMLNYGPNMSIPLGGAANPLNNSGFYLGKIRVS